LGVHVSVWLVLPQPTKTMIGQHTVSRHKQKLPVLYLLHGLSDDHTIWMRRTSIERYAEERGLAVIMPAVNRSFYTDMKSGYRYWTFIHKELPELMHRFFIFSNRPEDTFVAGLSMGGYGAFKLALTFPERFAAAASLSGAVYMNQRLGEERGEMNTDIKLIYGETGGIIKTPNDLMFLAEKFARYKGKKPKLYQYCGTEDFLIGHNHVFRDHARKLGIDLLYVEEPGVHEWRYWDMQIAKVIKWLPIKNGSLKDGKKHSLKRK
jgi:putative tributyrin esterase